MKNLNHHHQQRESYERALFSNNTNHKKRSVAGGGILAAVTHMHLAASLRGPQYLISNESPDKGSRLVIHQLFAVVQRAINPLETTRIQDARLTGTIKFGSRTFPPSSAKMTYQSTARVIETASGITYLDYQRQDWIATRTNRMGHERQTTPQPS